MSDARKRKDAIHTLRRRLHHLEMQIARRNGSLATPRDVMVQTEAEALRVVLAELGALREARQG